MESDQPLSSHSTLPSDLLHSLQPANTDNPAFQGSRFDERLLNHSSPSQGRSMCPEVVQGNCLLDLPFQSPMHYALHVSAPRGSEATPTL